MMKFLLTMVFGLFILVGCTDTDGDVGAENVEAELTEVEEGPQIERALFDGYWANDAYIIYIGEEMFYIQDKTNDYVNSFAIENEELGTDSMTFAIADVREEDSIAVIDANREVTFIQNEGVITFDEATFNTVPETEVNENFLYFVQTDGVVGRQAYQGPDLAFEDFEGPWMAFTPNISHIAPLGRIGLGISEKGIKVNHLESHYDVDQMVDYSIAGNTLTLTLDTYNPYNYLSEEENGPIEVTRYTMDISLFEEEDRDRLVTEYGEVYQRVTTEELTGTSSGMASADHFTPYPDFVAEMDEEIDLNYEQFDEMTEDEYTLVVAEDNEEDTNTVGYPYSASGVISELELYKERQIINGEIDHPEEGYDHAKASRDLYEGSFVNTPSYNNFDFEDSGYYSQGIAIDFLVGNNTIEDPDRSRYLEVRELDLTDHIYTVDYSDFIAADRVIERYFRISEDVFYKEDENGEFTDRFQKNIDWQMEFFNLPNQ